MLQKISPNLSVLDNYFDDLRKLFLDQLNHLAIFLNTSAKIFIYFRSFYVYIFYVYSFHVCTRRKIHDKNVKKINLYMIMNIDKFYIVLYKNEKKALFIYIYIT